MTFDEVVALLSSLEDVVVQRPGPGDGSPEIAWGDAFAYVGEVAGQPFATVVTKEYPGEAAGLDRPGAFRVNLAAGREAFARHASYGPPSDPAAVDVLQAHPTYWQARWLSVVDPGPRTSAELEELLRAAHAAALARRR